MNFEEVKKDYLALMEIGVPYDMTGGFVDAKLMELVIRNPTKTNAKNYMKEVIDYGFQRGYWRTQFNGDIHLQDNKFVSKMYDKYIL